MFAPQLSPDRIARFWATSDKTSGCWLWTRTPGAAGYGTIAVNGRKTSAHRVAYALAFGPFDASLCVCHHCDNPICVRPDHLFLGTHAENMADCARKGRNARSGRGRPGSSWGGKRRGEGNPAAKLTDQKVRALRGLHRSGVPTTALAKAFAISTATARAVAHGHTWSHVQ